MTTTADLMASLAAGNPLRGDDDLAAAAAATRLLQDAVSRGRWNLPRIAPDYTKGGPDESDDAHLMRERMEATAERLRRCEQDLTLALYHRQQARLQHAREKAAARLTPGPDGVLNPAADLVLPAETLARDLGGEA